MHDILFGALCGLAARWLTPGRQRTVDFIWAAVIGAITAAVIGRVLGWSLLGESIGALSALFATSIVVKGWDFVAQRRTLFHPDEGEFLPSRGRAARAESSMTAARPAKVEALDQLEKLAALRTSGVITELEFKLMKAHLLSDHPNP